MLARKEAGVLGISGNERREDSIFFIAWNRPGWRADRQGYVRRVQWFCGVILGMAGCASPQVVSTSLPLAGAAGGEYTSMKEVSLRETGASVEVFSLRETGVSEREERILSTRVSITNRTGDAIPFGPEYVYLADAGGTLFIRISEAWLHDYYDARIRGIPSKPTPKSIVPFDSAEVKLGDTIFKSSPLTAAEKDEVAEEMTELVEDAIVRPQRKGFGTFPIPSFERTPEVTLGVLLKEGSLRPGRGTSGFVYFYRPKAWKPRHPLRLIMDLQGEVHTFQFRER